MSKFITNYPQSIINFDKSDFETVVWEVFVFQFKHNPIYNSFCSNLGRTPQNISAIYDIPFLPIELYKDHIIKTGNWQPEIIFESSGTTGMNYSRNELKKAKDYHLLSKSVFEQFYGNLNEFTFLGLLPSYMEKGNSSLIYMIDYFMRVSENTHSSYFLDNYDHLFNVLKDLKGQKKVILWGVTYALLDFVEKYSLSFPELIIVETGGMKGRRKEITRGEVHAILKEGFDVQNIHSEYGMTELMSQAYSKGDGIFNVPKWMKVLPREINDPLSLEKTGVTAALNVIDLGNVHTCSFIATSDLGKVYEDGSFEVLGRLDNSDVRGCNLLVP